jgi:hypothetical protein
MPLVLEDIKRCLPEKCILYSFVHGYPEIHLKKLIGDNKCSQFIIKSDFNINYNNMKLLYPLWDNSLSLIESLGRADMLGMINPFSSETESKIYSTTLLNS